MYRQQVVRFRPSWTRWTINNAIGPLILIVSSRDDLTHHLSAELEMTRFDLKLADDQYPRQQPEFPVIDWLLIE